MEPNKKNKIIIPKSHPRYESLNIRHKIINGMKDLVVAEAGLIAHGRGEAFDYILRERTTKYSQKAIIAAISLLYLSDHPIISVNGNVAALVPKGLVKLSRIMKIPLEINLFYKKKGRINAIKNVLERSGATNILGLDESKMVELDGLESNRRLIDPEGIKKADTVFVPLEDGDRTEALKKLGKRVITVDLNPISRTALWADITIVDNIVRAIPTMIGFSQKLKNSKKSELKNILDKYNNKKVIQDSLTLIQDYIEHKKRELFDV